MDVEVGIRVMCPQPKECVRPPGVRTDKEGFSSGSLKRKYGCVDTLNFRVMEL